MAIKRKILVVAPHADDETLSMGGTIARYRSEGHDVRVAIMTGPGDKPHPLWPIDSWDVVRNEACLAMKQLGEPEIVFYNLPAVTLVDGPVFEVNKVVAEAITTYAPNELYIPYYHDLHQDHRAISYAALVAARGYNASGKSIELIAMYETPTETNLFHASLAPTFDPNFHVRIDGFLSSKLAAWAEYKSQHQEGYTPRSPAALEAMAKVRGAHVGIEAAEAFMVLRLSR